MKNPNISEQPPRIALAKGFCLGQQFFPTLGEAMISAMEALLQGTDLSSRADVASFLVIRRSEILSILSNPAPPPARKPRKVRRDKGTVRKPPPHALTLLPKDSPCLEPHPQDPSS